MTCVSVPESSRGFVTQSRQIPSVAADDPVSCEGLAQALLDLIPAVMRFIRGEMRAHAGQRLSVAQFRALAYLARTPGASLAQVAEHLAVTSATASALVDRLVKRGLVRRETHPRERRRVVLELTDEGRQLWDSARFHTRRRLQAMLAELSYEEQHVLDAALAALRRLSWNHERR